MIPERNAGRLSSKVGALCVGPMGLDVIVSRASCGVIGQTSQDASISICPGGVSRNVAENLARLGVSASLLTTRLEGLIGEFLSSETEASGVTLITGAETGGQLSSYCGWLGADGEVVFDGADYDAAESALRPDLLDSVAAILAQSAFVVTNSDVSDAFLERIVVLSDEYGFELCLLPGGLTGCDRLRPWIHRASVVVLSASEAEVMFQTKIGATEDAKACCRRSVSVGGIRALVITMGGDGAVWACPGSEPAHLPCPAVDGDVVSAVGGGDAVTAGVLCGLCLGYSLGDAVGIGLAAGAITVRTVRTCSKELSLDACVAVTRQCS